MDSNQAWIGVDFDGTLAVRPNDEGHRGYDSSRVGSPIPSMIQHVKNLIKKGHYVKIFTARVSDSDPQENEKASNAVFAFCEREGIRNPDGNLPPITCRKDMKCIMIIDDIAHGVKRNKGLAPSELMYCTPGLMNDVFMGSY